MADSRTRALIEGRPDFRSWAKLERVTGMDNLPRRLNQARRQGYIPLDVLAALHQATGIAVSELIVAMFEDAGYGYLMPYELSPELIATTRDLLRAEPEDQAMVRAFLAWSRRQREG